MNDHEIYQKLTELKEQGIVAGLATIVETAGSTPREAGAKMIICADGTLYGSVGGGCGESEVRSAALRSILTTQKPELLEIDLTDDIGTPDGDVCGGKMWIFVEPLTS
jgi:xanthine/CO dehydrogenase XdhC/CoxF family maturation factor